MKTSILSIAFTTVLLLSILTAKAQITSFTGTWKLQQRTSLTGNDYANGVPTILKVTSTPGDFTVERTSLTGKTDKPESVLSETLKTTDKVQLSKTPRGRDKHTTVKFDQSGRQFTISSELNEPEKPDQIIIKLKEEWSLSADGQTLTFMNYYESTTGQAEKWSMKGVYQKQ